MQSLIQNKISNNPTYSSIFFNKHYGVSEKYFYIILCHLHEKHKNDKRFFIGHDTITKNGVPSFGSFGISQRICKSARKKLKDGGLITFWHVYGDKGYRIGTEYALCDQVLHESAKEAHARILNQKSPELSAPVDISLK